MNEALMILQKSLGSSHLSAIFCNHNKFKNIYDNALEEANKLIEDNTIVSFKSYNEATKLISNLNTALNQFKECNKFRQSDVISKKILQTLDLLVKTQTNLY